MIYFSTFLFGFFLYALPIASSTNATNKWDCADYYWRDFFGTIPKDAIQAGTDHHGDPVYIGLVYIRNHEYLPASIYPKQKIAKTSAYGKPFTTTQHVKILCSPFPEGFEWIQVESKNLKDYLYKLVIPGGSQVGESLFIGRVFENDENNVVVGKIFQHYRGNRGIWYPVENRMRNSLNYELLVYDCDKIGPLIVPKVDVE